MNKLRRKTLQKIFDQLSDLREEIEAVKEEEDGSRENMPENLQGSEHYEQSETASSNMDDAMEYISSACDSLESVLEE